MHSAQELVTRIASLASLPPVYLRIREALESPDDSLSGVAATIAGDPVTTARLLHVVNSALYGFGGQVATVTRAVTILGLQQVHDLVLALSLHDAFIERDTGALDLRRFWRDSVRCGLIAREIGREIRLPVTERLFVVGLLADLGHLVMDQTVPELAAAAKSASEAGYEPLDAAERRLVGCDHAEVGASLMEYWKLPAGFARAIGAQLNPRLGGESAYEAAILHVSTRIVAAEDRGRPGDEAVAQIDPVAWSQLELAPEAIPELRRNAERDLAGYLALFFPDDDA